MTSEEYKNWLAGLKEGDKVAYLSGHCNGGHVVARVKKISPTRKHFEVGGSSWTEKMNEHGFAKARDRYSAPDSIEPLTEQILETIRRRQIIKKLVETDWVKLDTATLVKIYDLINPKP